MSLPPPPPPPQPSVLPSIQLMKPQSPASAMIRPTTAGLPQQLAADQQHYQQQQVPQIEGHLQNKQLFRDELLRKHSQLSTANTDLSIEDRIKTKKEELNELQHYHNQQKLPEKLLSTAQREKRPFAYSPDLNDPNNRGKFDLNQIKSETMRKRLMANMQSKESSEEDEENSEIDKVQVPAISSRQSADVSSSNGQNYRPATIIQYTPTATHQRRTIEQQSIYQPHGQFVSTYPSPMIQCYNEPPIFYNYHTVTQSRASSASPTNSHFDELAQEVADSIESLSRLVSNIQTGGSKSQQQQARSNGLDPHKGQSNINKGNSNNHNNTIEYHPPHRMSTFLPSTSPVVNVNAISLDSNRYQTPTNRTSSTLDRSVGDYLLSPDSNYFGSTSNGSPYSISPFYGSSLGSEDCGNASNYSQFSAKHQNSSSKTFSFNPHFNRKPTSRVAYNASETVRRPTNGNRSALMNDEKY